MKKSRDETLAAAPAAIIVQTTAGWRLACPFEAHQTSLYESGLDAPVVVSYRLAPGRPYRTEQEAVEDAALVIARRMPR